MRFAIVLAALALASCSSGSKTSTRSSTPEQRAAAAPAVQALAAGQFEPTQTAAASILASDPQNSRAAASRALATYILTLSHLRREAEAVTRSASPSGGFDHARMRAALESTLKSLGGIRRDLDTAAGDSAFELELCLACWERDWNHSGEVDDRDRRFLELELDGSGEEIPEGDPRRRPTFRFDVGDVHWARAMVAFQSASLEMILAYRWTDLDKILMMFGGSQPPTLRFELESPERVKHGRKLILAGLEAASQSRGAYLAESDDDREWVPSPTQKSHPLPLPVDAALYETWGGVLGDLHDLVDGKTGLSVAALAQLGDHKWDKPPGGFIDIGRMLSDPKTIVLELAQIAESLDDRPGEKVTGTEIENALGLILGSYYVKSMKPSPIVGRLSRMKRELDTREDTFERKMRYLFWLN